MHLPAPALPIDPLLPDLRAAIAQHGMAVLQAPPGAGKTTRVPLALLDQIAGRIVMLEPRRLAARAAAERLAESLGEEVGARVGYRIRGEARSSNATRIEVVTEGILTRMLQSDPSLEGIGAVIFDEFHERSLNADLGLALTLECRAALREDLALIVMSATLDAAPVADLLGGAPLLTSEGRAYPVETRWLDKPLARDSRLPQAVADLTRKALAETSGGILVFLPGEGEIRRTAAALTPHLPADTQLHTLFGAMDFKAQRAAIAPAKSGRKLVLATAIAETSLTISDIRVVVDAGLARRARFDPNSGMSRLVTERASIAEAEQRRGRAGRVAEGSCYRLWTKGQEGAMQGFAPAEIETADLSGLALELALWGSDDGLQFLTPPPAGPLAEARALLHDLGALKAHRITDHGRRMAALPLHPRLAHMLLTAGKSAAPLAALIAERDPLQAAPADLSLRLKALENPRQFTAEHPYAIRRETLERIRRDAKALARHAPADRGLEPAEMAALAYPDRIGLRRKGDAPRYLLSGGKGAAFDPADPLGQNRLIVATDLDGDAREARIRQALPLSDASLRALFGAQIRWSDHCDWSPRDTRIIAQSRETLGALILNHRNWDAPPEARAHAALDGIRALGLAHCGMTSAARRLQTRVELLRAQGADLPDFTDDALLKRAEDWLLPHLTGIKTADDLRNLDLTNALKSALTWDQTQALNRLAPSHFTTPLGARTPIDYTGGDPAVEVRLQELFGLTKHPTIGPARLPLKITLLSPARRPVQTTMDLPNFWATSYTDVRKDMRGKYPRHPWPEDPQNAQPTTRAKPRGT
ncbi:ATP-dependent helicase HrpB [Pararhodobacter oceanensis]|uniref:ATP-dependent helicase HrpB n=1 Tax=Pararhodobacter oceanensis TaxID=2172121 RepID=UPI003A95573D